MTTGQHAKYLQDKDPLWESQPQRAGASAARDAGRHGLHGKSLTRPMKGSLERKPHTKQRGRTYDAEMIAALEGISASLDCPGAERLIPHMVWVAEHLAAHRELEVLAAP
jgi:hypothetical protein